MRKIYINREQKKILEESMNLMDSPSLPSFLVDDINDGNFALANSPILPRESYALKMATERFEDVKHNFTDDITSYSDEVIINKFNKLISKCIEKEKNIRPQLEKICWNTLVSMFQIPEGSVDFECHLLDSISSKSQFHISSDTNEEYVFDSVESMDDDDANVAKRKAINALVMGTSMALATEVRKEVLNDIFSIDEELPHLYSKIMKINEYLLFTRKVTVKDNHHHQGGYVEVRLGSDLCSTKIISNAVIFPILLTESIRGFLQLFTAHGLPDDLADASRLINICDVLEDEPWQMRLGPVLWKRILSASNSIDTEEMPNVFMSLSEMPNDEFFKLMREIIAKTKLGNDLMHDLLRMANREREQDSFDQDMMQKQNDASLIQDDYFSDAEINEWDNGYEF